MCVCVSVCLPVYLSVRVCVSVSVFGCVFRKQIPVSRVQSFPVLSSSGTPAVNGAAVPSSMPVGAAASHLSGRGIASGILVENGSIAAGGDGSPDLRRSHVPALLPSDTSVVQESSSSSTARAANGHVVSRATADHWGVHTADVSLTTHRTPPSRTGSERSQQAPSAVTGDSERQTTLYAMAKDVMPARTTAPASSGEATPRSTLPSTAVSYDRNSVLYATAEGFALPKDIDTKPRATSSPRDIKRWPERVSVKSRKTSTPADMGSSVRDPSTASSSSSSSRPLSTQQNRVPLVESLYAAVVLPTPDTQHGPRIISEPTRKISAPVQIQSPRGSARKTSAAAVDTGNQYACATAPTLAFLSGGTSPKDRPQDPTGSPLSKSPNWPTSPPPNTAAPPKPSPSMLTSPPATSKSSSSTVAGGSSNAATNQVQATRNVESLYCEARAPGLDMHSPPALNSNSDAKSEEVTPEKDGKPVPRESVSTLTPSDDEHLTVGMPYRSRYDSDFSDLPESAKRVSASSESGKHVSDCSATSPYGLATVNEGSLRVGGEEDGEGNGYSLGTVQHTRLLSPTNPAYEAVLVDNDVSVLTSSMERVSCCLVCVCVWGGGGGGVIGFVWQGGGGGG